jgi:TetR/AcrR family transcriptional regulator, mexJK operon transcriptional repressor
MPQKTRRQEKTERFSSETPIAALMGRKDRKRAEIMAAAKEVFFAEGYSGASMDEIAARSGASKATLYAYFRSKDELVLAMLETIIEPLGTALAEVASAVDLRGWLGGMGCIFCRQATSPDIIGIQRLAIAEARRFPEIGRTVGKIGYAATLDAMRPGLEAAIARGELRPCDVTIAASQFFEMCAGKMMRDVLMGLSDAPDERQVEEAVRLAVDAFIEGHAA